MNRGGRGCSRGGLAGGRGPGGYDGKRNATSTGVAHTSENGKQIMITGTNYAPLKYSCVFGGNGTTSGRGVIRPPLPGLSRKRQRDYDNAGPQSKKTSFSGPLSGPSTPGGGVRGGKGSSRGDSRGGTRDDRGNGTGGFFNRGNARAGRSRNFSGSRGGFGVRGGRGEFGGSTDRPARKTEEYTVQPFFKGKTRSFQNAMVASKGGSPPSPKILNFSDGATRAVYILNLGEHVTEETIRTWIADSDKKDSIPESSEDTQKDSEMTQSSEKDLVMSGNQEPDPVEEDGESEKSLIVEEKIKLKEQKKERRKAIRASAAWTQKKLSGKVQNLLDNIRNVVFDITESNGKSRGNAYIEFTSPISAVLFRVIIEKLNLKNKTAENPVKYFTKFANVSKAPFVLIRAAVEKTEENTEAGEHKTIRAPLYITMSHPSTKPFIPPLPRQTQPKLPPGVIAPQIPAIVFSDSDAPEISACVKVPPGLPMMNKQTLSASAPTTQVLPGPQNLRMNNSKLAVYGSVGESIRGPNLHQETLQGNGLNLNQNKPYQGKFQGIPHNQRPANLGSRIQRDTPIRFQAPSAHFRRPDLGSETVPGSSQRGGAVYQIYGQGFPLHPYQRQSSLPQQLIYNRKLLPPQEQQGGYKQGFQQGCPYHSQGYMQGPQYGFQGQIHLQGPPQGQQGPPGQKWQYGGPGQDQYQGGRQYPGQQGQDQYGQHGPHSERMQKGPPPNQQQSYPSQKWPSNFPQQYRQSY